MRATLKDVAQRAGVSSATVSYVLNGKQSVSEKTKQRVLEAVRQLDYVPDLNARGLSMRDSKLIGVVVPQTEPGEHLMFQNTFYSEVLGSIEYYARQNGYHILISATDANESYQQMKESQIPIVLIDSYCNDYYYHNIRIDNAYGSYLATRYILQNGHREIPGRPAAGKRCDEKAPDRLPESTGRVRRPLSTRLRAGGADRL